MRGIWLQKRYGGDKDFWGEVLKKTVTSRRRRDLECTWTDR